MIFYVFAQQHRINEARGGEREGSRRRKHHKIDLHIAVEGLLIKSKAMWYQRW